MLNGNAPLRRVARVSLFATSFALLLPLGMVSLVGCGDAPPDGAAVKSAPVEQQGIDTMKNFMEKQKGEAKK